MLDLIFFIILILILSLLVYKRVCFISYLPVYLHCFVVLILMKPIHIHDVNNHCLKRQIHTIIYRNDENIIKDFLKGRGVSRTKIHRTIEFSILVDRFKTKSNYNSKGLLIIRYKFYQY